MLNRLLDLGRSTLTNLSQPVFSFTYRVISLWRTPAGCSLNVTTWDLGFDAGTLDSAESGLLSSLVLSERTAVVLLLVAREMSFVI